MILPQQQAAALRIITETLEAQKPIIVHDAHDSDTYILMLKGLSELSHNKSSATPQALESLQNNTARFMKSIERILPFLQQHGLMTQDFEFDTLHIDGQTITGLIVPDGKKAIERVESLYQSLGIASPFAVLTTGADAGMIDAIRQEQGIMASSQTGRA